MTKWTSKCYIVYGMSACFELILFEKLQLYDPNVGFLLSSLENINSRTVFGLSSEASLIVHCIYIIWSMRLVYDHIFTIFQDTDVKQQANLVHKAPKKKVHIAAYLSTTCLNLVYQVVCLICLPL